MGGTRIGGKRAAKTNKALHGKDFYKRIGKLGGQNSHTGGFAANRELARKAGAIGGKKSSRAGVKNGESRAKKQEKKSFLKKIFGGK